MDPRRFDTLTRLVSLRIARRRTIAAGLALLGAARVEDAGAATCRPNGAGCLRDAQCCSGSGCVRPQSQGNRSTRRRCETCTCSSDEDCVFISKVCRCHCMFATDAGVGRPQAFAALTSPEGIAALGFEHDVVPEVGARFTLRAEPRGRYSGIIDGQIVAIEPDEEIELILQIAEMAEPVGVRILFDVTEHGASHIELHRTTGTIEACAIAAGLLGEGWADRLLNQRLVAFVQGPR